MVNKEIKMGSRNESISERVYIVAEMSGNHDMSLDKAKKIIDAAAYAGADAIKLQTYTADTITIDCDSEIFMTQKDGLWGGQTLYELYKKAYTPWEWHEELQEHAYSLGIDFFSSPFDQSAVEFLEKLDIPAYKIASFEINDIPLLRKVAKTGKTIIMSTGIAYLEDIELAIKTCIEENNENIILLKCVSSYPSPYEDMNLNVIPQLGNIFGCAVGLSDHSLGSETAIASVALGARLVEKHITLSRGDGGVDSAFSMEPDEFRNMVQQIRNVERALGKSEYELSKKQVEAREGSRSLFVVKDVKKGEIFDYDNVKSIRPGVGMHTKYLDDVIGKVARCDVIKGTPMEWKYIE